MGSTISPSDRGSPVWGDTARSTGPLDEEVLRSITGESEGVLWAVSCPDGLTRIDGDDRRRVDFTVFVVVTEQRILFLAGTDDAADPTDAGSLSYDDIAATSVDDDVLELSTVDGVSWRLPLADADTEAADALVRHLGWLGEVRGHVIASHNDVDLAAGEIREAAASMDWEAGGNTYSRARTALDETIGAVQRIEPVPDDALAPGLTEMERHLEWAYAELLIERAGSRLTLGQQLVQNEDHEQARDVIESAHADYTAARDHAEALQRGDAFLFGPQRQLQNRLERLEWEIEAVAAEPLRQAHEARIMARSTSAPDETVEHWETAFRRYGHVLSLCEGDSGRRFAGDVEEIREELTNAAGQLIAIHQALARNEWDDGVVCHREGDTIGAILQLDTAVDHLERAHEVATEFRPEAADEMKAHLEKMREGLRRVRESGGAGRRFGDEADDRREDRTEDAARSDGADRREKGTITASELAELDTHHEITLTDPAMPGDDGDGADETVDEQTEIILGRDGDGGE